MPLTDIAIRSAKPQAKTVRLFDGGGLYIEVSPAGGKWCRWRHGTTYQELARQTVLVWIEPRDRHLG